MNEQTSQDRFEEFYKELSKTWQPKSCKNFRSMHLNTWRTQEAYWSKRVEEMEKAMRWYACNSYLTFTAIFRGDTGIIYYVRSNESGTVKTIGQGMTPLEAIQNAMKSNL